VAEYCKDVRPALRRAAHDGWGGSRGGHQPISAPLLFYPISMVENPGGQEGQTWRARTTRSPVPGRALSLRRLVRLQPCAASYRLPELSPQRAVATEPARSPGRSRAQARARPLLRLWGVRRDGGGWGSVEAADRPVHDPEEGL